MQAQASFLMQGLDKKKINRYKTHDRKIQEKSREAQEFKEIRTQKKNHMRLYLKLNFLKNSYRLRHSVRISYDPIVYNHLLQIAIKKKKHYMIQILKIHPFYLGLESI